MLSVKIGAEGASCGSGRALCSTRTARSLDDNLKLWDELDNGANVARLDRQPLGLTVGDWSVHRTFRDNV